MTYWYYWHFRFEWPYYLIMLAIVLLGLFACQRTIEPITTIDKSLVGTWTHQTDTLELRDDGTYTLGRTAGLWIAEYGEMTLVKQGDYQHLYYRVLTDYIELCELKVGYTSNFWDCEYWRKL